MTLFAVFALLATTWGATIARGGAVNVEPAVIAPGSKALLTWKNPALAGRRVVAHVGYNGWNLPLGGATAGTSGDQENQSFYLDIPMSYEADRELFSVMLEIPGAARSLHFVFCWDQCGSGDWDNNNGEDYGWPIAFPYIGPLLTWNERTRPESGVVIAFEHPPLAAVGCRAGGAFVDVWDRRARRMRQRYRPAPSVGHSPLCRFEVTGLKPQTSYEYQVGVDKQYLSSIYGLRTLAAPSAQRRLHFVAVGDAQDNGDDGRWGTVARVMAEQHGDAAFVVSTGDLAWNDTPGDWWTFFDRGRPLLSSHVFMPVVGNHDTPTVDSSPDHRSFARYFALPGVDRNRAHYGYAVGPYMFVALNSERAGEFGVGRVQYNWLRDELRERRLELEAQPLSSAPPWTFAYWHIGPFNTGARHWTQQYRFRDAAALFRGVVDWHFGGHEHLYQRFAPLDLRSNGHFAAVSRYGTGEGEGVGYLVVPSGGVAPEAQLAPTGAVGEEREVLAVPHLSPQDTSAPTFTGFLRVDVEGARIDLRTYEVGAAATVRVVDRVTYSK